MTNVLLICTVGKSHIKCYRMQILLSMFVAVWEPERVSSLCKYLQLLKSPQVTWRPFRRPPTNAGSRNLENGYKTRTCVCLTTDDREWVFWFPLLPTRMQSIPMPSHSHSQYCDLFPSHSRVSIPIPPIPFPSLYVAKKHAKHYEIKLMHFRTQTAKQLKHIKWCKTFVA